jgi:hypothetical protein
MLVDHECRRIMIKYRDVESEVLAVIIKRRGVFKIALVLRQDGSAVLHQTKRRLQLPAKGQQRRRGFET